MYKKLRTKIKSFNFPYHIEGHNKRQTLLYDESVQKQLLDNPIQGENLLNSITVLTDLSPGLQLTDRSNISKAQEPQINRHLKRANTFKMIPPPKEYLARNPSISSTTRTKIRCSSLEPVLPGDLCLFYKYRSLTKSKKRTVFSHLCADYNIQ